MAIRTKLLLAASVAALAFNAFAADDYVILEVDGKQIKKSDVSAIWLGLFPQGGAPEFDTIEEPIRQNVLRGVITEYLLYQEAVNAGIDKEPEVQAQINDMRRKLVARTFVERKGGEMVTEADVKAEYDKLVRESRDKEEVRARHILLKDEAKAKELKAKLDDGADFEKLAAEHSTDPGSKTQGGDLGYFTQEAMVKPFADAAFGAKVGEVAGPVKSKFGWHLIKVQDRRAIKIPTFTDVKEQLKSKLMEKDLNDYVSKLVDKSDVTYFGPTGKEKEFTKMPEPAAAEKAE